MQRNIDKYISLLNKLVIGLFIVLVFAQAGKKFVLDEIDFPLVAHATSISGVPIYYRGERASQDVGIYHPPLYIYTLAAFIKTFGYSENTVRAFGMMCTLLTAFLSILILGRLFPNTVDQTRFAMVYLPLFLLHPYTLANTTLPDIDQTVLPITILLFLYFLLKTFRARGLDDESDIKAISPRTAILIMSLLFALNLWAKMTTPFALLPAAFLILLALGYRFQRSVIIVTLIAAIGGALFLGTYWSYCHYFGLPFNYTFQFLVHSFTKGTSGSGGGGFSTIVDKIVTNFSYSRQFVNWLTLPFLFALFASMGFLIARKNKGKNERVLLIISFFGLFVSIFYLSLIAPFGSFFKYPYPVFSLLVMPIAYYLSVLCSPKAFGASKKDDNAINGPFALQSPVLLGVVFAAVFIPVALYQLFVGRDLTILLDNPNDPYLLMEIIVAALFLGSLSRYSTIQFFKYIAVGLFAGVIGVEVGISRSQAVAPYPTKYHYGQIGLNETIAYLQSRTAPDEIIWSMKDVGYYVNNKYLENYVDVFNPDIKQKLADLAAAKKIRYFVATKGIGQDRVDAYPALKNGLESCCFIDHEFGNFVIYKAKKNE